MVTEKKLKILFVCLGNICRSPLGEGIFKENIDKKGLTKNFFIDSAGTAAYHIGAPADQRMQETAYKRKILLTSKGRQICKDDFYEFDYILAMDRSNYKNILAIEPQNSTAKVALLRDFDPTPEDKDVPDPYYGGLEGFENVFNIVDRSCKEFYKTL